jgi:hypothetical protein
VTLVDPETGEVVAQCTPDEARSITERITTAVETTWHLVAEAYTRRAWAALGYSSWDDYTTREFGTSRLRLPREERQEVVQSLRSAGLSTRAIAAVTGDSKSTVADDLAGVQNRTPARDVTPNFKPKHAAKVTGTDGKKYTPGTKRGARAEAVAKYPWLDVPAPIAQIVGAAEALDAYKGAELKERIDISKKWAAMIVRRTDPARRTESDERAARVEEALAALVKFNVAAQRAAWALADEPELLDDDLDQWSTAIAMARGYLDDLTPVPATLRRVK